MFLLSRKFVLDDIIIENSNTNLDIKNIVSNSEKLIFDFSHIYDNIPLISSFIVKKLFNEVSLQDKSKFLFCMNKLDRDSVYESLENAYKWSKNYGVCFISTAHIPTKVNSKILKSSDIKISFKLLNKRETNKMSKALNISPSQISSLPLYEFIFKTPIKTIHPVKLDL